MISEKARRYAWLAVVSAPIVLLSFTASKYKNQLDFNATRNNYSREAVFKRAKEYKHKAEVLRQIQSAKLANSRRKGAWLDYGLLGCSTLLAFLTFVGTDKLHGAIPQLNTALIEFVFESIAGLLLFASTLQITLKFGEKSSKHFDDIKQISNFITCVDDIIDMDQLDEDSGNRLIDRLYGEYTTMTASLPDNDDREWRAAKQAVGEKNAR